MPGEAIETIRGKTVLERKLREAWNADRDGSLTPAHPTSPHEGGFERLVADLVRVSQRLERNANRRWLDLRHVV